ncbi:uncharacterized protein LOC107492766 [Arachis duranensis]|uniref:Uncharacterized protein LOC107492766 n=1 Tax=Arachis duranensis TaxID=130453 RepID=A0A6P4DMN3_ARADU|nr:uncharacterized protein LOC107492766 [Arachis duranensis]
MANVRPFEPLKLYIASSKNTIGCILAQDDENGHEQAVYYLSRVLTDMETRYSPIEKLCLSLYHACMKLKCYMVAKSVKVIAQTDVIKYMLSFPVLTGRLEKWMLALTEFDLQYVPAKAFKGQVIADFLVDNSKDLNDQGANIVDVEVNYWKLYFDGSKHKDGAGVGILIISPKGIPSKFLFELKYPSSNNVAEYENVSLVHIPRIHNEIANELAQIASRYRIGLETIKKLSSIHQILVPANKGEVLCMDEWEDFDWRKPIARYLKDPNTAVDRKIKLQVEAIPLVGVGQSEIIDFVEKNIIHRFEISQTLSTDQGTMFTGQRIKNFAASRNINMVTSTPYYAQANGQVDVANKILIGLIKK